MPDELLLRLRRFHEDYFPGVADQFQSLVREGQHPTILFIGCSGLGREAVLPVQVTQEALRRTEQRAIVLQLERLMGYPMVRTRVEARRLALHGWHYVLEDGEVHVFDVKSGGFVPAAQAPHSGTGPYPTYDDHGEPSGGAPPT